MFYAIILLLLSTGVSAREISILQIGHTTPPDRLAYSSDGKLIATLTSIGEVKVWNRETLAIIGTFTSFSGMAGGIKFSPDNRYLAIAMRGGGFLCDRKTGKIIHQQIGTSYNFSNKNGECLFIFEGAIELRSLPDFLLDGQIPLGSGPQRPPHSL